MPNPTDTPQVADSVTPFAFAKAGQAGLPHDLVEDASRRLGFVCLLVLGLTATNIVVRELWFGYPVVGRTAALVTLAAMWPPTLLVYYLTRSHRANPRRLLDVGLVYEVLIAATISVNVATGLWVQSDLPPYASSPVEIWVLLFAIIVPNTFKKTLIASVSALAMEPLAVVVLSRLQRFASPTPEVVADRMYSIIVSLVLTMLVSRVVYKLGTKLRSAREMGSYRLVERLGEGGMGEVWKATHRMLARSAAVKLIRADRIAAVEDEGLDTLLERFRREAQATAALRSPHTIEVYDYGISSGGTFYYVMELLEGVDLDTLVQKYGPQPSERVVSMLRQACHSLHEAHESGLIHRDIKPANLFLCHYGSDFDFVKVLDFGLVKSTTPRGPKDDGLTHVGAITGTPAFMPPEMALSEGPIDGRADLYALGCVAYWLLTGQAVFEAASAMAMLVAHVKEKPVRPSERSGISIPHDLEQIVLRCLEKDPADRPQSARDLAVLLDHTGLEAEWTEEQAREWWVAHGPPETRELPVAPGHSTTEPILEESIPRENA